MPTLVVANRKELYYRFEEEGKGKRYFMPLPTFEEIRELSSALETGMDDAALEERVKVGGHVFRYVADGAWTLEQLRWQTGRSVGTPTSYRIIASVNAVRRDTDDDSWVVHINVPRCATHGWRFVRPEYQFASD
jgi:hypothetical protein